MGFIGMVYGVIILIIMLVTITVIIGLTIAAITLKVFGKKKNNKKLNTAGNVCIVIAVILLIPMIIIQLYLAIIGRFNYVKNPEGNGAFVETTDTTKIFELARDGSDASISELKDLLDSDPNLVYYYDTNKNSILDIGLEAGNADLVELALSYGAVVDDANRYDYRSDATNSFEFFLISFNCRKVTEDDVRIAKLLLDNNASTVMSPRYQTSTNILGLAAWQVLYNDETVTDTEVEFIKVFYDNCEDKDSGFIAMDELGENYTFGPNYHPDVIRDANYDKVIDMVTGK